VGKDNQPKARQAVKLARKKASRASYDRILIVSEGSKTEPLYFNEIRSSYRLHSANVQVWPSAYGTQPLQVVEYAENLFQNGDAVKGVRALEFEQVYAVFDRDDHTTYHAALGKAASLNGKLINDLEEPVRFEAIASVPCFELWLLLHYEEILAPMHRDTVYERLRHYLPEYEKGQGGHFEATHANLKDATRRAAQIAGLANAHDGVAPYTDVHSLVALLTGLKNNE